MISDITIFFFLVLWTVESFQVNSIVNAGWAPSVPKAGLLGLRNPSAPSSLCFLAAGVHRVSDALQLHRVGEDGALAFHAGMDRHFLHIHPGNRKDERGNRFQKREHGRKRVVSYTCGWKGEVAAGELNEARNCIL